MKVLYISYSYDPARGVNAHRVFEIIQYLSSKNINITFMTPYPANPIKGVKNVVVNPSKERPNKWSLIYTNLIKSLYSLSESPQEEQWIIDIQNYINVNKDNLGQFDIIYVNTHPICLVSAGIFAKSVFKAKLVVDFQDPFYFNMYKRNLKIFDPLLKKREEKFLSETDLLIINVPSGKKVYAKNYPRLKVECIPNVMPKGLPKPKKEVRNDRQIKILYGGSLYIGRDLFPLLDNLKNIERDVVVEVLGDVSKINLLRYHKYKNVHWKGKMLPKYYYDYLNTVDIGVVLQSFNTRTEVSAIASKTYEYLYLNKAIIYIGPKGDNVDVIMKYSNNYCIITDPKDSKKLQDFLQHFKYNKENTKNEFYKKYTSENIFKDLKRSLELLIK